jgi:hypothetical protein
MSDVPSWLNEENISTAQKVASNPAVQKAAQNKEVQKAAVSAATRNVPPPPPPPKPAATPASHDPFSDPEAGRPPVATAYDPSAATSKGSEFVIEEETLKQMQKWHLALRCAYMAATILMCVASALTLQNQKDLGIAFFAIYVFFFAVLICCFEFALNVRND